MAILVLVLWLFTAGAGFSTLLTSNLSRTRPAAEIPLPGVPAAAAAVAPAAAAAVTSATPASAAAPGPQTPGASKRELKQERRERFDPPSLIAARQAPVMPSARALLEFAHPALGIMGLAFWLGFTLIHNRVLGWIAFGLVAVTASAGLAWFTANLRAANLRDQNNRHALDQDGPAPFFRGRLVALHGGAAALTVVLAALTALALHP